MAKITMILIASLMVLTISALQAQARASNTSATYQALEESNTPATPVDWFGLLATLTGSRQAEAAVLAPMMSSFLGLLATGKILPFIAPLLVSYLVLPFLALVKTIAKGLLLVGVVAWLISAFVPVMLAYLGLTGAGAMMARAMPPTLMSYVPYVNMVDLSVMNLANQGLHYMEMDSQECRMMMSCKAGEFMLNNYPGASKLLVGSGLLSYLETPVMRADPFTKMALSAMQGRTSCDAQLPACSGMRSIDAILDPQRSLNVSDISELFNKVTTTTTTPTPLPTTLPSNGDMIVDAIRRLASNYYGYSVTK